jgi:hypothetical protein
VSGFKEDKALEKKISMEIMVDCYDEHERALSWYYHLEEHLHFPFMAKCIKARPISPLEKGEEVEVLGMPKEAECEHEMFVEIKWNKRKLAVPLSQLEVMEGDEETIEAADDWHYWVKRGYQF